jgi:molybdopterin-containing oxidoreductase family iron-sulfur binding subunit
MKISTEQFDLATIRARLAQAKGPQFWRGLEELAETEAFKEFLQREFPRQAGEWTDAISRRNFLKLMGASLALAGLSACSPVQSEKIVPYVRSPEEIVPGKPLFFATAISLGGFAAGVLVESHMGRPTKIEGNPEHPASLGATDIFSQAAILALYDPDRSQVVSQAGLISTWEAFQAALTVELEAQRRSQGAGLRLLTETVTSPTLADQLEKLLAEFPQAKWHQYEPVGRDNLKAGAQLAFGEVVETQYHFEQANVILALDADFVGPGPGHLHYAREFMAKRRVREGQTSMNRLYAVESVPTLTGSVADHRLPLRAGQIQQFAQALAQELGLLEDSNAQAGLDELQLRWVRIVAADLQQNQAASLVIAGPEQPPAVQALVHAINNALGNVGETVSYTNPVEANPVDQHQSLRELVDDMAAGQVDLLLLIGGNPVYDAPADFNFAANLDKVKFRVHLGLYEDETSFLCHWHLPQTHELETWSDGRAFDGTATVMQPLISPLYDGRSAHELLALLLGQPGRSGREIVQEYWQNWYQGDDFELFWQKSLHDGLVAGTALPTRSVSLQISDSDTLASILDPQPPVPQGLEIIFRPDPTVWDGRLANNGWLQELPKPLTKLTWDNVALISPATAERLGLANGELVDLRYQDRLLRAPIWVMPGHAVDSLTVYLGYGRTRTGRVGNNIGYNAYIIRTAAAPWFDTGLEISKTGQQYPLATTQTHHSMEGRNLVRTGTLEEYQARPEFVQELDHHGEAELSLFPKHEYNGNAWGMAIDLTSCTGCNACVIACQAENNIPIVGKEQVLNSREMHWIRLDRYYEGDLDNPLTYHQPLPCMQCENAPCELVCPVAATTHSAEGLNEMVYNRCLGTRYCSNNCPYKVRRFNFLQYNDLSVPTFKLLHNPDVTVRTKGVMEKCTYCVQRINVARIEAKKENRPIRDGEVVTACQAVCPTQAIVFGNLNDPESEVARLKAQPLNYSLLAELNTHPRTTYLARLRNPNPELEV